MGLKPEKTPSGIYKIRGTVHGIRVQKSARTRSLSEAKQIAAAWERQLFDEHVLGKPQTETFAEIALDYLRAGRDLGPRAEEIIIEFGDLKVDKVTQAEVDALAARVYPDAKPSTINRNIIAPVSAIMRWAAKSDRAPFRSFERRRERATKTNWRRPDEIEAILEKFYEPEQRALAAIYVGCGLRASEAVFMDGREVAPDLSQVRVLGEVRETDKHAKEKGYNGTKSGLDRSIPIPRRARQMIAPIINTGPGRAFVSTTGNHWATREALKIPLIKACKRAGVEMMSPHDLRHTFATWHNAVHGDPIRLMAVGGWGSLSLVQRYAHAGDKSLRNEVIEAGWAIDIDDDPSGIDWSNFRLAGKAG